jgi:hypothetical protein
MQKALRRGALASILLHAAPVLAHQPQEGDIWGTVGPFLSVTKTREKSANDAAVTGAITAEGDVDKNGGVEIAMAYIDKYYARKQAGDAIAERIKRMYVTTGYRHWFIPSVSIGGAFFSSYSMGDAQVVMADVAPGHELKTTAHAITEYGMDFSLQYELIQVAGLAIVADGRYSLPIRHKPREDADTLGILIGCKYLVPKGRKEP